MANFANSLGFHDMEILADAKSPKPTEMNKALQRRYLTDILADLDESDVDEEHRALLAAAMAVGEMNGARPRD